MLNHEMDSIYFETPAEKLDSNGKHGLRNRSVHFPVLHAADFRGFIAWVHRPGHNSVDHTQ